LPLDRWIKANKSDNPILCALRLDYNKGNKENDKIAWELVFNDYLKKIGVSEEYQEYLDLISLYNEKAIYYLDNRERYLLNELNEIQRKIDNMKASFGVDDKHSIHNSLNTLSKIEGYRIKAFEITTLQYFLLIKSMKNGKE
jgi:hypothetical protein